MNAAAVVLDTVSSTNNSVVNEKAVANIPLNGRDFTQLIKIVPGYNGAGSINGARTKQNNYQIDGADNNDIWQNGAAANQSGVNGIAGVTLPIDAIDQFNVQSKGNADAGRNAGSLISLAIKSGTNKFHGSGYYFNRNGRAYRELIGAKVADHVAAIEMDGGAEKPLGIGYGTFGGPRRPPVPATGAAPVAPRARGLDESTLTPEEKQSFVWMKDIASLLGPINAATVSPGGGGSDIGPIVADGVPALSPRTVGEHYFDWHHTEADTLDKVDPDSFKRNTAMLSVVAYVLADMDGRLAGRKSAQRPE